MPGKYLLSGLFAIAILAMAADVYAANLGNYIGLQFGYSNTNQNGLPSSDVVPDVDSVLHTSPSSVTVTSFSNKRRDNVFAGRLFAGYQFYSNLAIEMGLTQFRNSSLSYDATVNTSSPVTRKDDIQLYVLDLMFKGSMSFNYGFDLFAKFGGALVYTRDQKQITVGNVGYVNGNPEQLQTSASTTHTTRSGRAYPAVAVGGSYYFVSDISADITYSRIIANSGSNNNISFTSIGVTYCF
jgi:hypothetical protein